MVGTPTVSTAIGMEGLQLKNGQHVLQADDPLTFADAVARLATDRPFWERLAVNGRQHIRAIHGREVVRDLWLDAIESVLARKAKSLLPGGHDGGTQAGIQTIKVHKRMATEDYRLLRDRVKTAVRTATAEGATVIVVSRGDQQLLELNGRSGWHFPQNGAGLYAGHYPADSAAAINHLEDLRLKGGRYLLFPASSLWWLNHYEGFRRHLDDRYLRTFQEEGVCLLYDLQPPAQADRHAHLDVSADLLNTTVPASPALRKGNGGPNGHPTQGHSALLVGGGMQKPQNLTGLAAQKESGEEQCLLP
jgi:hypothetical protein